MMGKKFVEIDRRRDELAVFEVALSSDVERKKSLCLEPKSWNGLRFSGLRASSGFIGLGLSSRLRKLGFRAQDSLRLLHII